MPGIEDDPGTGGSPPDSARPAAVSHRCGFVALIGRPNVGKSTLLNRLVGQKVSITTRKPQTTRHRLLGIRSTAEAQAIYVDTPGLHRRAGRAINRMMNRVAQAALHDVDLIVLVVEALRWQPDDELVLERVRDARAPVILAANKVDRVSAREALLPYLAEVSTRMAFAELIPVSATRGTNLDRLEREVARRLPEGPPLYPSDQVTDRDMRFLAAEAVREQLMGRLGEELPYRLTVEVGRYVEEVGLTHIEAVIWVERGGQKAIVIGEGGRVLKAVGTAARREIEQMTGTHVRLGLWVKVREGWSDDEQALRRLGYEG